MIQQALFPDFVFEASWEVCNKVGGIYTVLSSRAKTLCEKLADNLCFIGPDLQEENPLFIEEKKLFPKWQKALKEAGLIVRIGRWDVPGKPVALLVDFKPLFTEKMPSIRQLGIIFRWIRFMLTAIMTRLRCSRLQPDVLRNVSAENACLQMPRLFTKRMNG